MWTIAWLHSLLSRGHSGTLVAMHQTWHHRLPLPQNPPPPAARRAPPQCLCATLPQSPLATQVLPHSCFGGICGYPEQCQYENQHWCVLWEGGQRRQAGSQRAPSHYVHKGCWADGKSACKGFKGRGITNLGPGNHPCAQQRSRGAHRSYPWNTGRHARNSLSLLGL